MKIKIYLHPTGDISPLLKFIEENFVVEKRGTLPESDGEMIGLVLDIKNKMEIREFLDLVIKLNEQLKNASAISKVVIE